MKEGTEGEREKRRPQGKERKAVPEGEGERGKGEREWAKHTKQCLTKDDIQMPSKYIARRSISSVIGDMLIKTTLK